VTDWGWVTLAYVIVYGVLAAYAASVAQRLRRVRRELDGP
jgi:CcmD family protein